MPTLDPIEIADLTSLVSRALPSNVVTRLRDAGVRLTLGSSEAVPPSAFQPVVADPALGHAFEHWELEVMVSAWPKDTGLPNAIRIIPGNPGYGPRIKVAMDPTHKFTGDWAYVLFGEAPGTFEPPRPGRAGGPWPDGKLLAMLREFVELNRRDLYLFDRDPEQGGISGAELVRRLRKVPTR